MNWNVILGLLAALGTLLVVIGRWMIIHEARSFSTGWVYAIRFLPLADIMFLARFWDSAKSGAFMSIAGLVLMMPMGGKALWDRKHPSPEKARGPVIVNMDYKASVFQSMEREHLHKIETKTARMKQLHLHMTAWFEALESRRAKVANATASELAAFQEEAAAYSQLHNLTKELSRELVALQSKKFTFTDITNEEFAAFLARQKNDSARPVRLPGM